MFILQVVSDGVTNDANKSHSNNNYSKRSIGHKRIALKKAMQ